MIAVTVTTIGATGIMIVTTATMTVAAMIAITTGVIGTTTGATAITTGGAGTMIVAGIPVLAGRAAAFASLHAAAARQA